MGTVYAGRCGRLRTVYVGRRARRRSPDADPSSAPSPAKPMGLSRLPAVREEIVQLLARRQGMAPQHHERSCGWDRLAGVISKKPRDLQDGTFEINSPLGRQVQSDHFRAEFARFSKFAVVRQHIWRASYPNVRSGAQFYSRISVGENSSQREQGAEGASGHPACLALGPAQKAKSATAV